MRLLIFSGLLAWPAILLSSAAVRTAVAIPGNLDTSLTPPRLDNSSSANPSLHKRSNNVWQSFLGLEGWQISYITFTHILPFHVAAIGLQEPYQTAAVSALNNQLTQTPLSNIVVISIGGFRLTLSSNEMIPWTLLHAFSLRMATLSGLGFTPGYTIDFASPNGTVLRASLRISERARAI